MPPLSDGVFLTENRHKSFSNKLFINTAKYLGFRIFCFKALTKVAGGGMSKQGVCHPGLLSAQEECVTVNFLDTILTGIHQAEYLLQKIPKQSSPKDPHKPVFPRLNIPLKILQNMYNLSFWPKNQSSPALPQRGCICLYWVSFFLFPNIVLNPIKSTSS